MITYHGSYLDIKNEQYPFNMSHSTNNMFPGLVCYIPVAKTNYPGLGRSGNCSLGLCSISNQSNPENIIKILKNRSHYCISI